MLCKTKILLIIFDDVDFLYYSSTKIIREYQFYNKLKLEQ